MDMRKNDQGLHQRRKVLIVAGEGGHFAQAIRFADLIKEKGAIPLIISESTQARAVSDRQIVYRRNISRWTKTRGLRAKLVSVGLLVLESIAVPRLLQRHKPIGIVAFGPLFCVPFILFGRIMGYRVIFIETWSKFSGTTKTGKLAQHLAHRVYVQNKSLLAFFSAATYSGRL